MDEVRCFDWQGEETDMEYIRGLYGDISIYHPWPNDGEPYMRVVALVEDRGGACAIICTVLNADGNPEENHPVAWYWPDAPLKDPLHGCQPIDGVPLWMVPYLFDGPGRTNPSGQVGLAMGGDSDYNPETQRGAHALWGCGGGYHTEVISGLGWLELTNHWHVNVVLQWVLPEEPPPDDELEQELLAAHEKATEALVHIETALYLLPEG